MSVRKGARETREVQGGVDFEQRSPALSPMIGLYYTVSFSSTDKLIVIMWLTAKLSAG
ncbi:MAG: hypothetical protein PWQ96_1390 [Clostridia bacterium]|nr:hypothetical protein [Clostridia bacterium]